MIKYQRLEGLYVYRLYDEDGQPVYYGLSQLPYRRLMQHMRHASWWRDVATWKFTGPFASRQAALAYEAFIIRRDQPPANFHHNPALRRST